MTSNLHYNNLKQCKKKQRRYKEVRGATIIVKVGEEIRLNNAVIHESVFEEKANKNKYQLNFKCHYVRGETALYSVQKNANECPALIRIS